MLNIMMGGSIELSAPNIQVTTCDRAAASRGISAGLRSAMCRTIAPDSNNFTSSL
jgi:sulfur relay (sulfurtransferase) complex TusBCD TusD component (DsrE family)